MKAELAVLGAGWPEQILRTPGEQCHCHFPGSMTSAQRVGFMEATAPQVRGVLTSGTIGIDAATAALFPSPHVGSFTVEARRATGELAVGNLMAHFAGKPALTSVGS